MNSKYLIGAVAFLFLAVGYLTYAVYSGEVPGNKTVRNILSLGGPTQFDELRYPAATSTSVSLVLGDSQPVKEFWVNLSSKRAGSGSLASTTNQMVLDNTSGRTLLIDRIIGVRTGTSAASYIIEIATTSPASANKARPTTRPGLTTLYDYDITYAAATRTPTHLLNKFRFPTSTEPYMVFDSLMALAGSGTTTAKAAGDPGDQPYFDLEAYQNGINGTHLWNRSVIEWVGTTSLAVAINRDQYTNGCGRAGTADGCATMATSTWRGFDLDIFVHVIATSSPNE